MNASIRPWTKLAVMGMTVVCLPLATAHAAPEPSSPTPAPPPASAPAVDPGAERVTNDMIQMAMQELGMTRPQAEDYVNNAGAFSEAVDRIIKALPDGYVDSFWNGTHHAKTLIRVRPGFGERARNLTEFPVVEVDALSESAVAKQQAAVADKVTKSGLVKTAGVHVDPVTRVTVVYYSAPNTSVEKAAQRWGMGPFEFHLTTTPSHQS